jgi:hypothetical protein
MQTTYIVEAEMIDNQTIHLKKPLDIKDRNIIITIQKETNKSNKNFLKFGCLKDKIKISDDFNAPLDDFKDYM